MVIKRLYIKLETCTARYGSSGAKPSKVKSTASSKFKAISMRASQRKEEAASAPEKKDTSSSSNRSSDKQPLTYGSHSGNIQVYPILDLKDIPFSKVPEHFDYIDNLTATLESKSSFDIRKAKHDYLVAKDEILGKYYNAYGSNPSDDITAKMLNELKLKSFEYSKTQIVICITTDEYIEGSRLGADGFYHLELRTKALWRRGKTLLTPEEIKMLIGVDTTKKIDITSTRVTVERYISYNPDTGHYKIIWGSHTAPQVTW